MLSKCSERTARILISSLIRAFVVQTILCKCQVFAGRDLFVSFSCELVKSHDFVKTRIQ